MGFDKKNMVVIGLMLLMSGCMFSREPAPSPGLKATQFQAIAAYERGNSYMGQGRYLLARQQFSEAAAMAVTQGIYNDAMAGQQKVDGILQKRRQYHE